MTDVELLFFEAAGCLMAIPASEVTQLEGSDPPSRQVEGSDPRSTKSETEAALDLDEYFTRQESGGPWLCWRRGTRTARLRVRRVDGVTTVSIAALKPVPALLLAQAQGGSYAFLAVGVRGDDLFLLLDPARLKSAPRPSTDGDPFSVRHGFSGAGIR
jgi:hypothetical protein